MGEGVSWLARHSGGWDVLRSGGGHAWWVRHSSCVRQRKDAIWVTMERGRLVCVDPWGGGTALVRSASCPLLHCTCGFPDWNTQTGALRSDVR